MSSFWDLPSMALKTVTEREAEGGTDMMEVRTISNGVGWFSSWSGSAHWPLFTKPQLLEKDLSLALLDKHSLIWKSPDIFIPAWTQLKKSLLSEGRQPQRGHAIWLNSYKVRSRQNSSELWLPVGVGRFCGLGEALRGGPEGCLQGSVVVVMLCILAKIHWEVHSIFVHFTVGLLYLAHVLEFLKKKHK